MGDLGAHIIDLARYLVGEFDEVTGMAETFIKERPVLESSDAGLGASGGAGKGLVTVEDAAAFVTRFTNGAMGTFEVSRFAARQQEQQYLRDQRQSGQHPLQPGAAERTGVSRSQPALDGAGFPRPHDHRWRPPVYGGLVARRSHHRLGTHLHPRGA